LIPADRCREVFRICSIRMTTSLDIEALVDQRSAGQTAQLIGMSNNSHGIRDMAVDCCKQANALIDIVPSVPSAIEVSAMPVAQPNFTNRRATAFIAVPRPAGRIDLSPSGAA